VADAGAASIVDANTPIRAQQMSQALRIWTPSRKARGRPDDAVRLFIPLMDVNVLFAVISKTF